MAIDTMAGLREVYRPPAARAGLKVLDHLDVHCRRFIALSPFYVISSVKVTVEEAFLHCAKALIRARLWEADAQVGRSCYPTYGQVLADQIAGADAAEIDAGEAESARTELY